MLKSHTAFSVPQDESPFRRLPLVDLLVDTRTELLELVTRSGLKVLGAMLEEDRTALCGPRYAHEPDHPASRAGTVQSEIVLGGPQGRDSAPMNTPGERSWRPRTHPRSGPKNPVPSDPHFRNDTVDVCANF